MRVKQSRQLINTKSRVQETRVSVPRALQQVRLLRAVHLLATWEYWQKHHQQNNSTCNAQCLFMRGGRSMDEHEQVLAPQEPKPPGPSASQSRAAISDMNFCVPFFKTTEQKSQSHHQQTIRKIEPTIADCTTVTRPARSAKKLTNNSGKLPMADCTTPVAPGPR